MKKGKVIRVENDIVTIENTKYHRSIEKSWKVVFGV